MGHTPISIFTDCGNGYGVALVKDGDKDPVRADVDLHKTDGKVHIRIKDKWVEVGDDFVSAYKGMTSSNALSADSARKACEAVEKAAHPTTKAGRSPVSPLWFAIPTLSVGGAYAINKIAGSDLSIAVRDPGMTGTLVDLGEGALTALYTASFIPMTRRSSHGTFLVANFSSLGVGAAMMIVGLAGHGRGTPEFSTGLTLASTGALGTVYGDTHSSRNPTRFYTGLGLQAGLGATAAILSLAGVGSRSKVSGSGMYAPPGTPPGSRDVPGNPYEGTPLPALDRALMLYGIANLVGAGINWFDRDVGGSSPSTQVGVMTPPGGGVGLQVSGTF
jgi:hypothetical protein